jgi:hypothetical protein
MESTVVPEGDFGAGPNEVLIPSWQLRLPREGVGVKNLAGFNGNFGQIDELHSIQEMLEDGRPAR